MKPHRLLLSIAFVAVLPWIAQAQIAPSAAPRSEPGPVPAIAPQPAAPPPPATAAPAPAAPAKPAQKPAPVPAQAAVAPAPTAPATPPSGTAEPGATTAPVVSAEPQTPASPSSAAPTAPAAPEPPTAGAQAAVHADLSTAAADSGEPEAEPEKPWLPWMASISWTQGYTAQGVSRSSELTFNPTYAWSFYLTAGYNFDKATSLVVGQYGTVELTDSDTTTTRQEFVFWDTSLDLGHKWTFDLAPGHGLKLAAGAGAMLPTSKESRAATMIVAPRARVGATYSFSRVLAGLDVGPSFIYMHRFNRANVEVSQTSFPCLLTGREGSVDCNHLDSPSSITNMFLLGLDSSLHLSEKWTAGLSMTFWWSLAASFPPTNVATLTGPQVIPDQSTTHWRNVRWLLVSLGYKITDYLSTSLRVIDIFAERDYSGHLRAPFNPIDTVIGLELGLSIDQLYLSTKSNAPKQR